MSVHRARSDLLFGVGEYPAARAAADELLVLARSVGNRRLEATALVQSGSAAQWMEDFDAALARAQEAVEVSEASGDQFGLAGALSVRAFVLEVQGNPEQAVPEVERALAISRSIGNFGLQGEVAFLGTLPPIWQGRFRDALAVAHEGVQIGREHRLLVPLLRCLLERGRRVRRRRGVRRRTPRARRRPQAVRAHRRRAVRQSLPQHDGVAQDRLRRSGRRARSWRQGARDIAAKRQTRRWARARGLHPVESRGGSPRAGRPARGRRRARRGPSHRPAPAGLALDDVALRHALLRHHGRARPGPRRPRRRRAPRRAEPRDRRPVPVEEVPRAECDA